MKGTIIGSDLLQKEDSVKVIEINTNTTIYNDGAEFLDYTALFSVLVANNINELHFIYTAGNSYLPTNAASFVFEDKLKEKCLEHNIEYYPYIVPANSITIPYVEDASNKFILRQAFDTTALVDETYCADKFEFLNLMSGSNYIPNTFFNDSDLGFDTINSINLENPNEPNYIIKSKSPRYDSKNYPAIYGIETENELIDLKNSLPSDHLIQEFIYDDLNIIDGKWAVIRSIDIIYGNELDVINMGGYTHSTRIPLSFASNEFVEGTKKYNQKTRYKYINKQLGNFATIDYHVDSDTMILDYTGSLVDVDTIQLGTFVKSVDFTDLSGSSIQHNISDITTFGWDGTLEKTIETLTDITSSLVGLSSASVDTIFVKITLENGLNWDDSPSATYYIEESGSLSTRWEKINNMYIGDKLIVKNNTTNQLETIEITNLEMVYAQKTIYDLDFEDSDLFLVDIGDGLFGIMHNSCWCCGNPCGHWCCSQYCPICYQNLPPGCK
jgi:hypothetical protein